MASSQQITIGKVAASEVPALSAIVQQSLHFDEAWVARAFQDIGLDNFYAARQQGRVVAGGALMPMAQWFGGQRVPCAGVTFVGVAWEARGSGVGRALMRALLAEARRRGMALSALYPSSPSFYRRVGYEEGGTRLTWEAPLDAIASAQSELRVRSLDLREIGTLRQIYGQHARRQTALLDRPLFVWRKLLQLPGSATHIFVAERNATPEGYLVVAQNSRSDPLMVRDLCALNDDARTRLLGLLAAQRTMVKHMQWQAAPGDPLADLISTSAEIKRSLPWMLRIVDVPAALSQRGYLAGQSADLHLEIHDDVLPWNHGRFVLSVRDGKPEIQRGGRGELQVDVRDLASIYTGHRTPADLAERGKIRGLNHSIALLAQVFGWQRPRLADMF